MADKLEVARNHSALRDWVSYGAIGTYGILAAIVVVWFLWAGQYGMAIGALSIVGGLAVAILEF